MEKFIPFFIFLGVMFGGGLLFYIFHKKPSTKNYQKSQSRKPSTGNYQDPVKRRDSFVRNPPVLSAEQQEARKRQLNSIINTMRNENQTKLLSLDDITSYSHEYLSPSEIDYIAKQLPTSLFSTSVWDIHQKIKNQSLTDDEILAILNSGTQNLLTILKNTYSGTSTWTMSSMLLGQLILKHPLALFYFNNYNKDMLMTMINRLSAYELLGYRIKPSSSDESVLDLLMDLKNATEDDKPTIEYYESADTDMVYFIAQNYPNETEARAKAFVKILSGSVNIVPMIDRVGEALSDDEMKQIIARNYPAEISTLFDSCTPSDVANCFPPLYAIKVALELIECDYSEEIKDNYGFAAIPMTTYQEVINSLSADELLGYDDRGEGNYDIIKLFEDNSIEEEKLRELAFAKMSTSKHFSDAICRWDTVTDDEVANIMEQGIEEHVTALLDRNDSDVISNIPEEMAIKIMLEIKYPEATEAIKDNYSFGNKDAFLRVINELSAYELLGFCTQANTPDEKVDTTLTNLENGEKVSIYHDGEYDIISLIENDMDDDTELRTAAFAKICEAKNMADAIGRWVTLTQDEIAKIMQRDYDEEVNALLGRDNSESIIEDLPEEVAIKIALELMYEDAAETVRDNYCFSNKDIFLKVINELSPYELLGFRIHGNGSYDGSVTNLESGEKISIYHDGEYDIISLIENNMSDDIELRTAVFTKICEAKNMVDAIARWETVTDDEIAKIMQRGYQEEINALLGRDDSDSIIENLPEEVAIKVALELVYEDAAETLRNNYSFSNKDTFLKVINELSPYELLGFRIHGDGSYDGSVTNLENGEEISIYHDGEYDIISLIENDMSDDTTLRTAAFAKICESKNMVDAIARWENVTDDEIAKIMQRGYDEEINALLGRDDSDSIIENLPEEVAIKVALELVYEDAAESLRNNYSFSNKDAFLKVINELSPYELLGFRIHGDGSYDGSVTNLQNPGEEISFYHDGAYDIISLIENDMSDDIELRTAAFAKICESKNMVDAIARWENVTDDEATKIMQRGYQEEIDELFDRSDSDDIISSLPDTFIIKQHLLSDTSSFHDEYNGRITDETFQKKVEKLAKKVSLKKDTAKERDGSADELSDSTLIRAMLGLVDFDECSFDIDDVTTEFEERRESKKGFKQYVESFLESVS